MIRSWQTALMVMTMIFSATMGAANSTAAPGDLTDLEWQAICRKIDDRAYDIVPADGAGAYRAVNRTHRIEAIFNADGFSATVQRAKEDTRFSFSLTPTGYGRDGNRATVAGPARLQATGNRIDLVWSETLTEWHENTPTGLRQNFTISENPDPEENGPLVFTLALGGELLPGDDHRTNAVSFKDATGRTILTYSGLKVYDAQGRVLPATMEMADASSILVRVDDAGACYPVTIDPLMARFESKLAPSDGEAEDYFGNRVAISGDTLVVGAHGDDDMGDRSGSAYVFERDTYGAWTQRAKLTASDGQRYDYFGISVAVDGDVVVVGAYGDDDNGSASGSAYVFEKPAAGWALAMTETAKLTASDGAAADSFGYSVAVSEDTVVVGAYGDDDTESRSGSAYVFEKPAAGWASAMTETAKLTASDGAEDDFFGRCVAVSGDTVVAGAHGDDDMGSASGAVYVFEKPTAGWVTTTAETTKLTAFDGAAADYFGYSVAASAGSVAVGAYGDDDMGSASGSTYVFEKPTAGWGTTTAEVAKLTAFDGAAPDFFGSSVAISGDVVAAGAYRDNDMGDYTGSAYAFKRTTGGSWLQTAKLTATDAEAEDYFGCSVAISEDSVVVGAFKDDDLGSESGAAYIFTDFSIIEQPQAGSVGAAVEDGVSADYPFDINASFLDAEYFVVHGALSGPRTGILSTDLATGIWSPATPLLAGETATAWLMPGIVMADSTVQQSGVVWQFITQPVASAGVFRADGVLESAALICYGAALGDVDSDGDLDAVFVNFGANTVWINDGTGRFSDSGQTLGSSFSYCAALGDIDNDGDLDLVFANAGANTVWLNDGTGNFSDSGQTMGINISYATALGDMDTDGDLDLVFGNTGNNKIWLNNGDGTFFNTKQFPGSADSNDVVLGDVDADGDFDLVVANDGANKVWINNGAGLFSDSGQLLGSAFTYAIALGDLNDDACPDLVAANAGGLTVWQNDCDGGFSETGQALAGDTRGLSLGDVDGDGDLDVLAAVSGLDILWLNDGSGIFSDSGRDLNGETAVDTRLGDMDGDGDLDILAVNSTAPHTLWLNDDLPAVAGGDVTEVDSDSATATASLTFTGGYTVTAHGFVLSTTGDPILTDTVLDIGAAADTGSFSGEVTGLSSETTYYVRAYATNAAGTVYGETVDFTTLEESSDNDGDGTEDVDETTPPTEEVDETSSSTVDIDETTSSTEDIDDTSSSTEDVDETTSSTEDVDETSSSTEDVDEATSSSGDGGGGSGVCFISGVFD